MSLTKVPEPQLQDPFIEPISNSFTLSLSQRKAYDSSSIQSIDWESRILHNGSPGGSLDWLQGRMYDANSIESENWDSRTLLDNNSNIVVNWNSHFLIDTSAITSLEWVGRQTFDAAGLVSIGWNARELVNSAGGVFINWETGTINGLTYPTVDGAAGDVLTTDGAGVLTFQPASGGGLQSGSEDIGSGVDTISVVFGTAFAVAPAVVSTISRPVAENLIQVNIDEASITTLGFTASLSANTGSANYKLKWMAN